MSDEIKSPISDSEIESASGGAGDYRQYAKGSFVDCGDYILYTVAPGDALSGIAIRFGVGMADIQGWNDIPNPDIIYVGQQLVIYPQYFG